MMTRIARKASLVAVLLLLTSVGTASAECAWVLWYTSGRGEGITSPMEAHATKGECETAIRAAVRTLVEAFAFLTCLPDTIDPRGPKGK